LAGIAGKAIQYYQQAATYAQKIFANHQAITFLKRAIILAEEMSEVHNPDQLSTVLHTQLAIALVHLKGYGASDVYQACEHIRILSKKLTETPDDQVLRMLAINRVVNADFSSGYELGQELLSLAKHTGNAILEVEAYYVLGVAQHWRGKYQEAKLHFNEVLTRYDPRQSTTHIQLYGQDPALVCRIRLANVLLALGEVEEAQALGAQSLKAAIDCGHPFSLGYVRTWLAWLNNVQEKVRETRQEAENSVAYSTKYEFPFWHTWSNLLLGWALTENGEQEKGISIIEESLDLAYASNSLAGLSYFWCLLASALSTRGEFINAFQLIEKAQAQVEKTGERWMEAELYRIKAEIILKRNPADQSAAIDSFKQAIAIAREQGAVYLEQKALLCLSRITQRL
jgi:adenylate cyclase